VLIAGTLNKTLIMETGTSCPGVDCQEAYNSISICQKILFFIL